VNKEVWSELLNVSSIRLSFDHDFSSQSFSLCRSFSPRSSTPVSVNKPPSVLAAWQALYRHSKSPHSSSFTMLSGAIIISIPNIYMPIYIYIYIHTNSLKETAFVIIVICDICK